MSASVSNGPRNAELLLAHNWPISKVRDALDNNRADRLVLFLKARYCERFFEPIHKLRIARGNRQGFGFAIMALCSLLIESIQCCRDGLPSTHPADLKKFVSRSDVPPAFAITETEISDKTGSRAFEEFFKKYVHLFPGVDGASYYQNVRNGLLHQGQTKAGWRIKVGQQVVLTEFIIDRNHFADAMSKAFGEYLKELKNSPKESDLWKNARRRIWWLIS